MEDNDHIDKIFVELDKFAFWGSSLLLILLGVLYFLLPKINFDTNVKNFLEAIITNLIPTIIIFCFTYLLIRRFRNLRSEHNQQVLIDGISSATSSIIDEKISHVTDSIAELKLTMSGVQESLITLWQIQDGSQSVITDLINKMPVATPQDFSNFMGTVSKLGRNPKLPRTAIDLEELGAGDDED